MTRLYITEMLVPSAVTSVLYLPDYSFLSALGITSLVYHSKPVFPNAMLRDPQTVHVFTRKNVDCLARNSEGAKTWTDCLFPRTGLGNTDLKYLD